MKRKSFIKTSFPPPALSGSGVEKNFSWVYSQPFWAPQFLYGKSNYNIAKNLRLNGK